MARSRGQGASSSFNSSSLGQDVIDRAIAIGALMGEERNLVGMGLVAASAMNRTDRPGAYLSRSASLGDVFAAPYSGRERLAAVVTGRGLGYSDLPAQYSTTINTPGTRHAYDAFRNGVLASVGYGLPNREF